MTTSMEFLGYNSDQSPQIGVFIVNLNNDDGSITGTAFAQVNFMMEGTSADFDITGTLDDDAIQLELSPSDSDSDDTGKLSGTLVGNTLTLTGEVPLSGTMFPMQLVMSRLGVMYDDSITGNWSSSEYEVTLSVAQDGTDVHGLFKLPQNDAIIIASGTSDDSSFSLVLQTYGDHAYSATYCGTSSSKELSGTFDGALSPKTGGKIQLTMARILDD